MLRAERWETAVSYKKGKYAVSSNKVLWPSYQRGSILIGLIVTMVVMASLGAGMVYLTTTSTFQELFANNHARAYYLAESGGRYTTALVRQAFATGSPTVLSLNTAFSGVAPSTGNFTMANGKFQIENWVEDNGGPGGSKQISFDSTGTVNSGFLQARRRLHYKINPANQSGGSVASSPPTAPNVDLQTLAGSPVKTGSFAYKTGVDGGSALLETAQQGGGNSAEAYLGFTSNMASPFYNAWVNAGKFLSYDAQVKVTAANWNGTAFTSPKPAQYVIGLTFRYTIVPGGGNQDTFLGASFVRSYTDAYGNDQNPKLGKDNISDNMVPSGNDNVPMIMVWTRGGNHGGGDDSWLAYKTLGTTSNVITTSTTGDTLCPSDAQCVKNWSTIETRIVEAASIKLSVSSAPEIVAGTTITGGTGQAKVIKKIKDNNGKEVLLLNNVTTGFSMPGTIGTGITTRTTTAWRPKDNYIWVFYGDTTGTSGNTIPTDLTRLLNERGGTLNWPAPDIATDNGNLWTNNWSIAYDHFTLVNWDAIAPPSCTSYSDSNISCTWLMGGISGTDYEYNSIIRLNDPTYVTQATYSASTNPELGVVAVGGLLEGKGYFADLAYYINSGGGSGGVDGGGGVIVSP